MNDPHNQTVIDNSFSTFMFGLTIGVVGAMLLGTEEGRQVTRKLLKSLSEGIERNEDLFQGAKNVARQAITEIEDQFKSQPASLPDQPARSANEPPPPPPPFFNRPRSTPSYFHNSSNPS